MREENKQRGTFEGWLEELDKDFGIYTNPATIKREKLLNKIDEIQTKTREKRV